MSDLEINKHTLKPKAEHMSKGELVAEFRKLQKWYNSMKEAVTELEEKHAILQRAYDEAVNLNLTMNARVKNQETLLVNEVTSNNEKSQRLYKQIEEYQKALRELRDERDREFQKKLK